MPSFLLFADDLSAIHDRAATEVGDVLCVAGMSSVVPDRKDIGSVAVAFDRRRRLPPVHDEDQVKILRSYQGTTGSAHAHIPATQFRVRRLRTTPESAASVGMTVRRAKC